MVAASPSREDVEREFGKDCVTTNPDGSWTARVRDPEQIKKAASMLDGVRRVDKERGARYRAENAEYVTLRSPDGRAVPMRADLAESVARRRGLHEAPKRVRATKLYRGGRWYVWHPGIGYVEE